MKDYKLIMALLENYFYDYINHKFTGDKYKKIVLIDETKYSLHDNFKLYIFKNSLEQKIK